MTATTSATPVTVNGWTMFNATIRVGNRVVVWQQFAPDAVQFIIQVQEACNREFPTEESSITDWHVVTR